MTVQRVWGNPLFKEGGNTGHIKLRGRTRRAAPHAHVRRHHAPPRGEVVELRAVAYYRFKASTRACWWWRWWRGGARAGAAPVAVLVPVLMLVRVLVLVLVPVLVLVLGLKLVVVVV